MPTKYDAKGMPISTTEPNQLVKNPNTTTPNSPMYVAPATSLTIPIAPTDTTASKGTITAPSTVYSGNVQNNRIPDLNNKLNQYSNTGTQTGTDGKQTYSNGQAVPTEKTYGYDKETGAKVEIPQGASLADYGSLSPVPLQFGTDGTATVDNTPENDYQSVAKGITDQINAIKAGTDPQTASMIDAIHQQYEVLRQQQTQANQNSQASLTQGLITGGAARYGRGTAVEGLVNNTVSFGLSQIQSLNAQEQSAVAKAKQAQIDQDYPMMKTALDHAEQLRTEKVVQAQKIADKLSETTHTQTIDSAVIKAGSTDPKVIADNLKKMGVVATSKEINDSLSNLYPEIKDVQTIQKDLLSVIGVPQSVKDAVGKATTMADAISAAGTYLQKSSDPDMNKYLDYARTAVQDGLTPLSKDDYQAKQDEIANTQAYNKAYATAKGSASAKSADTASEKTQQALEQQGRQVVLKELAARTGALGTENAKVNQANHLDSLLKQYYDPKTGNYNVPKAQYTELVMGLANMISPSGTADMATRKDLNAFTAKSDLNGALQYLTGSPKTGNTQEMIKNMVDSIDRQAQTAVSNREAALQNMRDMLPTDLEESRKESLVKSTQMVQYTGQERISRKNVDDFLKTSGSQTVNIGGTPHSMYYAISQMYAIPGTTSKDVEDYLSAQGLI